MFIHFYSVLNILHFLSITISAFSIFIFSSVIRPFSIQQPTQSQIVNHHTAMELSPEIQHKEKLIKLLKKEVKRMMEVIHDFIHIHQIVVVIQHIVVDF